MIKKINDANAGVKRPLRVSDIQDVWTALNKINGLSGNSDPVVVSGFYDKGDGYLSEGVIAKDGVLYYHPDVAGSRIAIDANAYGNQLAGVDQRVFEDQTTQDFSFDMVANITSSAVDLGIMSLARIEDLRPKGVRREVTGVVKFDIGGSTFSFTPDDSGDNDIVITYTFNGESLPTKPYIDVVITLTDGDNNSINKDVTITPVMSDTMRLKSDAGLLPDTFGVGEDAAEDLVFIWNNLVALPSGDHSYRIKGTFGS